MAPRSRSLWLLIAAVAYVAFAAISQERGPWPWVALCASPLGLMGLWRWTSPDRRTGERFTDVERQAIRTIGWALTLYAASRTGPPGSAGLDVARTVALGVGSVASAVLLSRVQSAGGLAEPPAATRSLDAAAFIGLLWGLAVGVAATRLLVPSPGVLLDPVAVDYATTAASLGTLMVLVATSFRLRLLRKLDLGAAERASGALALSITALAVALPATALDIGPPDLLLESSVLFAVSAMAWAVTTRDPTLVARALRATIAVLALGAPAALFTALVARRAPLEAGWTVLLGCAACILVGFLAERIARPLGPDDGRLLAASARAREAALEPEPESAVVAALRALNERASTGSTRPEIWRFAPPEVLSVDIAGYLHRREAEAPPDLQGIALGEPERTLRAEVLRSLEVRRPDLRPLLGWMDQHDALCATLIVDEDGPSGFILLPRANRRSVMTLEEARALRLLADRLSSLFAVSGALARSRARELASESHALALETERARLERILSQEQERQALLVERWVRRVRSSAFSPNARLAITDLERTGQLGMPAILRVPTGVDVLGWAGIGHLSSSRAGGPLVIVEGTNGLEHDPARWESGDSPLSLADGGTLLLVDAAALPLPIQELIARRLSKEAPDLSRASSVPPPVAWVVETKGASGARHVTYHPALERYLGQTYVEIPGLDERSEDLRSLALSELVALGFALRGQPLGLSKTAQRWIAEHEWKGNDVELRSVLTLAAERTTEDVVTEADLQQVGLNPPLEPPAMSPNPLPVGVRRRQLGWRSPRGR